MQQLAHQRNRRRLAFVVNEYGDIDGLITLADLLEEIVGEFTSDPVTQTHKDVHQEASGAWLINATATIRALNRSLGWQLPTDGPKTVNGLRLGSSRRYRAGTACALAPTNSRCCRPARARSARCARACAPRNPRRIGLLQREPQRLGDLRDRAQHQAFGRRLRRIQPRQDHGRIALLAQLAQALLAARDRAHFTGQAELAESGQAFRQRLP
jgi:hypothetical protein